MYNNKSLTRDNLAKIRHVEDKTCVFCAEPESIQHLLFDCIIPTEIWVVIAEAFNITPPMSFESLSSFWKKKKQREAIMLPRLLPCGAYGACAMVLSFRGEDGEICAVCWIGWGQQSGSGRSYVQRSRVLYFSGA